jgi:uncharacterized protein
MAHMKRLGRADYRDMPWKNGGGVTRELLRLPHPRDAERFVLRLSIATVAASGPFSRFAGVDRLLLILEGEGVALSGPETEAPVVLGPRSAPFAFPGEGTWDCRLLGGPVRDFNVMVDRALASATLERVHVVAGGTHGLAAEAGALWLHGLAGRVRVAGETLEADETLGLEAPGALELHAETEATVLAIRVRPRPG